MRYPTHEKQKLELENRGGARANVDEVDILLVNGVKKIDRSWICRRRCLDR